MTGGKHDTFREKIEQDRRTRRRFFFRIEGDLLYSPAFNEIANSGCAVVVLLHVIAKQTLPPRLAERKRLERAGLWPPRPQPFSFPQREAPYHGLTEKGLAKALRCLHETGFIDRISSGSAKRRGDFAVYIMSDRWRDWGHPDFKVIPWPEAQVITPRGNDGKYLPGRIGKGGAYKTFVAADFAATENPLTADFAATGDSPPAESAVNRPPEGSSVAAKSAVLLSSPSLSEISFKTGGGPVCEELVAGARLRDAAAELISHLPDEKQTYIIDLLQQVDEGDLLPRHARTKVIMPRLLSFTDAYLLFPDPLKYGMWGPLEERLDARDWT